jgi:hypothetical protein
MHLKKKKKHLSIIASYILHIPWWSQMLSKNTSVEKEKQNRRQSAACLQNNLHKKNSFSQQNQMSVYK